MIYFLDFKASYTIYMIQNESRVSKLCSWSFKTMWGGNYPTLLETQNFMTPCYFGAPLSRFPGKTRMKKGWYHYHPAYVLTLLCRLFTVHASFPVQTVRLLWHVPCGWSALRHSLECDPCPSVFLRSTRLNWNRHLPTALFITDPCLHLYFMSCWEKDNKNGKIGNKSGKIFIWMW